MMSENFVFTREMENVFKREHIQIQPTNRQLMNFTSQNTPKKTSLTHSRTHMEKERHPKLRGKNNSFALLLLYRSISPSLNLSHESQLFRNFCFALSFPSGFSILSFFLSTNFFFSLFFTNEFARGLFTFFNMGQRINCC